MKSLKEKFGILFYFFKPHKRKMTVVFFVMAVSGLLESLNLAVLYPILNYGLNIDSKSTIMQVLDRLVIPIGHEDLFVSSCVLLIIVTTVASAVKVFYHILANRLVRDIIAFNQRAIFKKFEGADYNYFIKNQQGKLIYASTVAPLSITNNVFCSLRILHGIVTSLFFIGLLALLSWQGMILVVVIGGFYTLFIKGIIQKIVNKYAQLTVVEDQKKNVILNEFITGIKSIKAYFNQKFWDRKYSKAVESSAEYNYKVLLGRALPDTFLKFIFFTTIALMGILINMRYSGQMLLQLPALGTFVGVLSRLVPYINLIGTDSMAMMRFIPDMKIVHKTLLVKADEFSDGDIMAKVFRKSIAFENVSFCYEGAGKNLLEDLSFEIEKQKITAIVGPSGSGKSTIVSLLMKLFDARQGCIKFDSEDIRQLKNVSYLAQIGYVGQETFIFNGTIRDNIRFGDENISEESIVGAAKLANAHEFIIDTEGGYGALVGDAGMRLSGGQRQRIAIARAMARHPQILILDEATSSLDNISEQVVQEAINNVSKTITTLIIAHRLSTVKEADKILFLENGRIIEEGTHEELIQSKRHYFQLYTTKY